MRSFACRALLFLVFAAAWARGADIQSPDDPVKLAKQVHDIFEAKCIDCHGPELPRPKGKFGYVLDLKRVAANPDYVVPGKPDKSDLYNMVSDDEMPGEDANVPPLTSQEKAAVKHWIEIGAPCDTGAAKTPEPSERQAAAKPAEPFFRHLLRWAGRFHPVTTHFPVALMFVAVLAEALGLMTGRRSWAHTVQFCIIIAALGAVGAATSGWVNASFSSYNKAPWALLWWHRWLGTSTAIWAVICAGASFLPEDQPGFNRRHFRVALFFGAVLVGVCGFLGSALIYGLDHYAWY